MMATLRTAEWLVRSELELIIELQTDEYLAGHTAAMPEDVRKRLR
jgi:hypothetical protein